MPFGIILLPDADATTQLVEWSRVVSGRLPALMSLDEDRSPPHLTILHVDCDETTALACWDALADRLHPTPSITLDELEFAVLPPGDRYVPEGGVFCGFTARHDPALIELHHAALSVAAELGADVTSAAGDRFSPHLTAAVLCRPPSTSVDVTLELSGRPIPTRAALGRLDTYGTFPELLREAPS